MPIGAQDVRTRGTAPDQLAQDAARWDCGPAERGDPRATGDDIHSRTMLRLRQLVTTMTRAATTRHREPFEPERAATSRREPAEHGITEFSESLRPTHEENWCELGQLLQALGHQRWTMLLMLMLACAELFVPGWAAAAAAEEGLGYHRK